jgi:DNA-binding CsgD family transcriptional regulator
MATRDIDFIAGIYDAVLDPNGLAAFTDLLMRSLDSTSAALELVSGGKAGSTIASNIPDAVLAAYRSHYRNVSPFLAMALKHTHPPPGVVVRCGDMLAGGQYWNCEFFVDFARPAGTVWTIGGAVILGPSSFALIGAHRPQGDPDFSDAECLEMARLMAPAGHALRLRDRLGKAAGYAALQLLDFGAAVCDGAGRLVFANAAAEALVRRDGGLGLRGDRLSAELPSEADRLAFLITAAAKEGRAGAMIITGRGDRLFLVLTPLPRRFSGDSERVLITLRSDNAAPLADAETLSALFGLTPAEARVGAALSTGASAAEIARGLGVGEETVRTHIKRLLEKSGAANQRAFIAMLGRLTRPRYALEDSL